MTLDTIGVVFSRTGDHADAVPLFERAVVSTPATRSYFYNLGAARQFSGDFDGAELAYRRALELGAGPVSRALVTRAAETRDA